MTVLEMMSGLPPKFYFSSAAWFLYAAFVTFSVIFITIVLFIVKRIMRARENQISFKFKLVLSFLIVLFLSWPLIDALMFSYETAAICSSEGGLRVYDTAEAAGFHGHLKEWSTLGFSFIEHGGPKRTKVREIVKDGQLQTMQIEEFNARYRIRAPGSRMLNDYMRISEVYMEDQKTGKRLGEIRKLIFRGTKFDRIAARLFKLDRNPHFCGDEATDGRGTYEPRREAHIYYQYDLVKATLIPTKNDY